MVDNNDILNHFFKEEVQPEETQDFSTLSPIENADEIVMIIDCSGSMGSILEDAEGGVNAFITEQREADGDANITLCEFDSNVPDPVYSRIPIGNAPAYKLRPRGMTALRDAIGINMNKFRDVETTGQRIAVIVTDGHENNSKEYRMGDLLENLIGDLKEEGWEFVFLAADEAAMAEGASYGFDMNTAVQYDANMADSSKAVYGAASTYTTSLRSGGGKAKALADMDNFVDGIESIKKA